MAGKSAKGLDEGAARALFREFWAYPPVVEAKERSASEVWWWLRNGGEWWTTCEEGEVVRLSLNDLERYPLYFYECGIRILFPGYVPEVPYIDVSPDLRERIVRFFEVVLGDASPAERPEPYIKVSSGLVGKLKPNWREGYSGAFALSFNLGQFTNKAIFNALGRELDKVRHEHGLNPPKRSLKSTFDQKFELRVCEALDMSHSIRLSGDELFASGYGNCDDSRIRQERRRVSDWMKQLSEYKKEDWSEIGDVFPKKRPAAET